MIHENILSITPTHVLVTDTTNDPINISLTYKESQFITSTLNDYISRITGNVSISNDTGILPPGLLYISDTYLIFERPPCYQNIQMIHEIVDNIDYNTNCVTMYRIPVPWQLYIVTYTNFNSKYYPSDVRMYFMKNSVHMSAMENQEVYLPPLPNFFPNGLLCRPRYSSSEDIERYSNDLSGVINAAYDWIWNSGTNMDLSMSCVELIYQSRHFSDNKYIINPNNYFNSGVVSNTYFVSGHVVHQIMNNWESIQSLDNISQYDWPYPSYSDRPSFNSYDNISDDFLHEYFAEMGIDDYHSCNQEYDDCECELPQYDRDDFHAYVRKAQLIKKTLFDMIRQIIREEASAVYRNQAHHNLSKRIYDAVSTYSA